MYRRLIAAFAVLTMAVQSLPAMAGTLQCVPYAREVSGIDIRGNAKTWWAQAEGRYERGNEPKVGAVLNFRPTRAMPQGHVATVGEIVDERHILLDHANWSGPGKIERRALAEDVSEAGDWSSVRVWYGPIGKLGLRASPAFGFIYNDAAESGAEAAPAVPSEAFELAFADLSAAPMPATIQLASAR